MQHRPHVRGMAAIFLSLVATAVLAVSSVAAHSQTVNPNGNGDGFVKPISNPWAQAHCHAQAPAVVFEASDGVVRFSPAGALPCPASVTNPGGEVTGP
jgi:hypothetical protein